MKRLRTTEAPRVLGFRMAANGQWKMEYKHWRKEATALARRINISMFCRKCGEKVYPSIWLAKLRYVASVVGLTGRQMDDLNKPVVAACLSVSGFNRKMPRGVIFGPERYGGLGWERASTLQTGEYVKCSYNT